MPSKSRVNKDMLLRIDYNVVGENDVPQPKSQNQTLKSAGNSNMQDQSSAIATLSPEAEAFPKMAPATNPLAPFPTNPAPFEGIPIDTLRHLPAPSTVQTPEPLPDPPKGAAMHQRLLSHRRAKPLQPAI
ncbi:hypothetical protein G7Y79_00010g028940 [Physcia stellaris]|nr:hypothetical protein G7Y79_00010g028940 [Physcia stellaris]